MSFSMMRVLSKSIITIDIDLDNVSFDQALEQIRKQTSLQLSKVNNTIVVSLAKQVLASSGKVQASRHRVTGRVTDANNEPLIGVSIVIQGNSGGTITDIDGRYTLEESGCRCPLWSSLTSVMFHRK